MPTMYLYVFNYMYITSFQLPHKWHVISSVTGLCKFSDNFIYSAILWPCFLSVLSLQNYWLVPIWGLLSVKCKHGQKSNVCVRLCVIQFEVLNLFFDWMKSKFLLEIQCLGSLSYHLNQQISTNDSKLVIW